LVILSVEYYRIGYFVQIPPVISVSTERLFSKWILVKTKVKTTMSKDCFMTIICEPVVIIDIEHTIDNFSRKSKSLTKVLQYKTVC